jgi:hypothetical protein
MGDDLRLMVGKGAEGGSNGYFNATRGCVPLSQERTPISGSSPVSWSRGGPARAPLLPNPIPHAAVGNYPEIPDGSTGKPGLQVGWLIQEKRPSL